MATIKYSENINNEYFKQGVLELKMTNMTVMIIGYVLTVHTAVQMSLMPI